VGVGLCVSLFPSLTCTVGGVKVPVPPFRLNVTVKVSAAETVCKNPDGTNVLIIIAKISKNDVNFLKRIISSPLYIIYIYITILSHFLRFVNDIPVVSAKIIAGIFSLESAN
jgi:hypothetical protein